MSSDSPIPSKYAILRQNWEQKSFLTSFVMLILFVSIPIYIWIQDFNVLASIPFIGAAIVITIGMYAELYEGTENASEPTVYVRLLPFINRMMQLQWKRLAIFSFTLFIIGIPLGLYLDLTHHVLLGRIIFILTGLLFAFSFLILMLKLTYQKDGKN